MCVWKPIHVVAVVLGALALALGGPATLDADTYYIYYVNGTTGNNAWNGLCPVWDGGICGPKRTIQAGIDAATHRDEVVVAALEPPNVYSGEGNTNLEFGGRRITVHSDTDNPDYCIIDCNPDPPA